MRYKTYQLNTEFNDAYLIHEGDDRLMAILHAEDQNESSHESDIEEIICLNPHLSEDELDALAAKLTPCIELLGITWDTQEGKLVYWEDHDSAGYPPEKEEAKPKTETETESWNRN